MLLIHVQALSYDMYRNTKVITCYHFSTRWNLSIVFLWTFWFVETFQYHSDNFSCWWMALRAQVWWFQDNITIFTFLSQNSSSKQSHSTSHVCERLQAFLVMYFQQQFEVFFMYMFSWSFCNCRVLQCFFKFFYSAHSDEHVILVKFINLLLML